MTVDRQPHEHTALYPTPRKRSQPSSGGRSRNRNGLTVTT